MIAPPDGIDISKCIGKYTPNKQLISAKIIEYTIKPFIDFDKFFAAAAGIKSSASTSIEPIIFTDAIVITVTIIIKIYSINFTFTPLTIAKLGLKLASSILFKYGTKTKPIIIAEITKM